MYQQDLMRITGEEGRRLKSRLETKPLSKALLSDASLNRPARPDCKARGKCKFVS